MAEAPHTDNLRRLLDITRQMAATTDLTELLGTIVTATCEMLACERATIFLYDKPAHELYSRVATGADVIRFPADRGIAGAAAQQRAVINVRDAYADPRFNPEIDRQTGFRTRNLLTFPLENHNHELMGVLQALNRAGGPFTPADENLARDLAAQAGIAIHRYALLEQYAQKQRMARDLELARKIQQQLFPKTSPLIDGYDIAGWNLSADETGGDCYDFIPLPDGRLAILLADATGHGIGAALVIAECRALIRALLSVTRDLPTIALSVNNILSRDLLEGRFVTAFLGILDPAQHHLDYVAAGQGPLLFVSAAGVEARSADGLPLAVLADVECPAATYDFTPGGTAVLLTDGFYETDNPAGEQFGDERVIAFVRERPDVPLDRLIAELHAEIKQFRQEAAQGDDLTAVLIRRRA
jgi:phosphoserine phosphatase